MSDDRLIRVQNLNALCASRGWGPADLVREAGSTYSYWRDVLTGEKSFGEKAARKTEESLGLVPRGMLDHPQTFKPAPSKKGAPQAHAVTHPPSDDVLIPEFDTGGKMGNGGLVLRDQPGVIHSWRVSPEWVQKNVRQATSPANLAIVTGFGDSMRGMFNPGDPLLVDTGVREVKYDAVYFFRVDDEGFIKRLQRVPGQGLIAMSENKAYKDWTVTKDMSFEVFGRVLKVWKGEEF